MDTPRLSREDAPHTMSACPKLSRAAAAVALFALPVFAAPANAAARGAKGAKAAKDFHYTVSDCRDPSEQDGIRLELSEGAIAFSQTLTMNCVAATRPKTVSLAYAKKGRNLEVTITIDSAVLADCTCPIGIEGSIGSLAKGTYHLSIFYEERAANEKPTRRTVAERDISIQ
jgi:hypothetical protein